MESHESHKDHYNLTDNQVKRRINTTARKLIKKENENDISSHNTPCKENECPIKEKLKVMFMKADKDGNGYLSESEFSEVFGRFAPYQKHSYQKNVNISFEEFSRYFEPIVTQHVKTCEEIKKRKQPENDETVVQAEPDLEPDSEQYERRRLTSVLILKKQLNQQKSNGLRTLVERTASNVNKAGGEEKEELFQMFSEEEEKEIDKFITERWEAFINFKRKGRNNEIVMISDEEITDALPGHYDLLGLVMDQFDLSVLESTPKHVVLKPVKWMKAEGDNKHGRLLCPRYWKGTIPVDIGTNQNLKYYGACFATENQKKVALLHRHVTTNFVYSTNYHKNYVMLDKEGAGGCGIEHHAFHHMDCPLDDESGFFLLGKLIADNELHLTAFKIPKNHVLYVPPDVVHSNDFMLGKWRTMLADNVGIDHVHFYKETEHKGCYEKHEVKIESVAG